MIAYHVTPYETYQTEIKHHGLVPQIGDRSKLIDEDTKKIYFFPNIDSANDAISGWLGDILVDDGFESVVILRVDLSGLDVKKTFHEDESWELYITEPVSPDRIALMREESLIEHVSKIEAVRSIINESKYIGSCVDVGYGRKRISIFFKDATQMAQVVGDPDEGDVGKSKQIDGEEFFKFVDMDSVPKKALRGQYTCFYVAEDEIGYPITPEESALFFIYNEDQDVHYFFERRELNESVIPDIRDLFLKESESQRTTIKVVDVCGKKCMDKRDADLLRAKVEEYGNVLIDFDGVETVSSTFFYDLFFRKPFEVIPDVEIQLNDPNQRWIFNWVVGNYERSAAYLAHKARIDQENKE